MDQSSVDDLLFGLALNCRKYKLKSYFSEYNEQLQKEVSNVSFFVSPTCNYTVAFTTFNIYNLYPGACTLTYFLFYTLKKNEIEYISANTHTAFFLMYFYNYQAEVSL